MATRSIAAWPEANLMASLADARNRTDELFRAAREEALYDRTIPERHRIIFYIGHLEAFDWNLLGRDAAKLPPFNEAFDKLFAFGIDPVDGGLPQDQPRDWPALTHVREYCEQVRRRLDDVLHDGAGKPAGSSAAGDMERLNVAVEHRLMHAETLAYILHHLPHDRKVPQYQAPPPVHPRSPRDLIEIPLGTATLGLRRDGRRFGWDNEFEEHRVAVPGFSIQRCDVSHEQFLEFMDAGGYERPELWEEADWAWKELAGRTHPFFWIRRGDHWNYNGMFEEMPLPMDWPVYVSYAEASAYARWAGKQLPTEEQFHRAAYGTPEGVEREFPWGDAPPTAHHGNFDFHRWDPVGVGSQAAGDSAFHVADLVGNGWEWTRSEFRPFKGFEPFPFYPGYSANFFDGRHYVMKGGSPRTAACMLRRSFRNWFQPHYPYVYATFRCVEP